MGECATPQIPVRVSCVLLDNPVRGHPFLPNTKCSSGRGARPKACDITQTHEAEEVEEGAVGGAGAGVVGADVELCGGKGDEAWGGRRAPPAAAAGGGGGGEGEEAPNIFFSNFF